MRRLLARWLRRIANRLDPVIPGSTLSSLIKAARATRHMEGTMESKE